jgi:hypothetical protein
MNDHIVSAGSLRNLEVRLNRAIDAVIQAETDLNALRRKAAMAEIPKAFYLPSEHRIAVREAESEARPQARPRSRRKPAGEQGSNRNRQRRHDSPRPMIR